MDEKRDRSERTEKTKYLAMRSWALIGVAAVFVLVVLALGLIWPAVELLLVGVLLGFICSPITNWLDDRGVGRGVAALIALLVVLLVSSAVVVLLVPPFVAQLVEVLQLVPSYITQARDAINEFWASLGDLRTAEVQYFVNQAVGTLSDVGLRSASQLAKTLADGVMPSAASFVSGLVTFSLGVIVAYWLAKDYPVIVRELVTIAGPQRGGDLSVLLAVMSRSMGGYMRGIVITSLACGALSFVAFALIGHPYAGLMAIVALLLHFIPVIGSWLALAIASLLALFVSPVLALETLVAALVIQNLTDNVISPLVMQSAVKVHPALSLVGLIVGNALGGILGMAIAIPMTAALRSVFVYYFESKSGRQLVSYDGALFRSTPFHDELGNVEPVYDALDDDKFFQNTRLVDPSDANLHPVAAQRPEGAHPSLGETLVLSLHDVVSRGDPDD